MQLSIFDILYEQFKIDKPVRLIEFFAGIGSQAKALKNLNVNFEHHKICEWATPSILAYNEIHKNELSDYGKDFSKDLSKQEIVECLFKKGISSNYNNPMEFKQIQRLPEAKLRSIYNAIQSTHNLVNIQNTKGVDLNIVDKDTYIYILTYSFPCQDLSLAGLGKGMSKGGQTRSGMLWEVERILDELKETNQLPQVLLMENVPQVIGTNNIKDFQEWRNKLESLGYSNYVECLNSKDYGIPQNRERCFMISFLGEYSYTFPKPFPLENKLRDLLEDNVDEKYFLSQKMIDGMSRTSFNSYKLENKLRDLDGAAATIIAGFDRTPQLVEDYRKQNERCDGLLENGQVTGVVEKEHSGVELQIEVCNKAIQNKLVSPNDVIEYTFSNARLKEIDEGFIKTQNKEDNQVMSTLVTNPQKLGVCVEDESLWTEIPSVKNNLRIRKLTGKECYRLMGFSDEDCENARKVLSESMIYHTAGDSIVVNVLMEIFKGLL